MRLDNSNINVPGSRWIVALFQTAWSLAFVATVLVVVITLRNAPQVMENDHHLAPSIGMLRGYPLYSSATDGPVLCTIYAPFSAISYMLAGVFSNPVWQVRMGVLLSMLYYFLPASLLVQSSSGNKLSWQGTAKGLALMVALTFLSNGPEVAATIIRADSTALGAAALSCLFLGRNIALAGAFAAVSVLSKQNMTPFLVAVPVWLLLRGEMARAAKFCAAALIAGSTAVLALSPWLGGLPAMALNLITVPSHQEFRKVYLFTTIATLEEKALLFLLLPLSWAVHRGVSGGLQAVLKTPQSLFLVASIILAPTSILGFMKVGGSVNALAPTLFFAALSLCVELLNLQERGDIAATFDRRIPAALLLTVFGVTHTISSLYYLSRSSRPGPMELAYEFGRAHPGEVYFPQYPLATLDAEGKLYHLSWGLADRRLGGQPVTLPHVLRYLPATRVTAIAMGVVVPEYDSDITERCHTDADLPGYSSLPGFTICRLDISGPNK